MENKFGADVSEPRKSLEVLVANSLSSMLEKNELASAKACERIELECERVMEKEANQPIPSKGKFRKRYRECADRFRQTCVGPARDRNRERLDHAWEREVARFDKEFNDRLLNGVVFLTIAWVVVFRFIVRVAVAETIGWIAFVFLQVYPRTFIGSGSTVYETGWWEVRRLRRFLICLVPCSLFVVPSMLFLPCCSSHLSLTFLSLTFLSHTFLPHTGSGQGMGSSRGQRHRRPRHPHVRDGPRPRRLLLPRPPAAVLLLLLSGPDTPSENPRDERPRRVTKDPRRGPPSRTGTCKFEKAMSSSDPFYVVQAEVNDTVRYDSTYTRIRVYLVARIRSPAPDAVVDGRQTGGQRFPRSSLVAFPVGGPLLLASHARTPRTPRSARTCAPHIPAPRTYPRLTRTRFDFPSCS